MYKDERCFVFVFFTRIRACFPICITSLLPYDPYQKIIKIIFGQNYSTYEDALKQLNWESFDSRRHGLTYRFGLNYLNIKKNLFSTESKKQR